MVRDPGWRCKGSGYLWGLMVDERMVMGQGGAPDKYWGHEAD